LPDYGYKDYTAPLFIGRKFKEMAGRDSFYKNFASLCFDISKNGELKLPDETKQKEIRQNWEHIKTLNVMKANLIRWHFFNANFPIFFKVPACTNMPTKSKGRRNGKFTQLPVSALPLRARRATPEVHALKLTQCVNFKEGTPEATRFARSERPFLTLL